MRVVWLSVRMECAERGGRGCPVGSDLRHRVSLSEKGCSAMIRENELCRGRFGYQDRRGHLFNHGLETCLGVADRLLRAPSCRDIDKRNDDARNSVILGSIGKD